MKVLIDSDCLAGLGIKSRQADEARVLLDITRLMRRSNRSTPTGVDRVEMAYTEFFSACGNVGFLTHQSGSARVVRNSEVSDLIAATNRRWAAPSGDCARDTQFHALADLLSRPAGCSRMTRVEISRMAQPKRRKTFEADSYRRFARMFVMNRSPRMLPATQACAYLNVGQQNMHDVRAFTWLSEKKIPAIFLIHDLIPMEMPELCRPGEDIIHARRMLTAKTHATALIANSRATENSIHAYWRAQGWPHPRTHVIPLGVDVDCDAARKFLRRSSTPYFVVLGTIEHRKNQLLLAAVWRDLVSELGNDAPRLLMIGARGWQGDKVTEFVKEFGLGDFVMELSDLGDEHLAWLLGGARALLAPSLAEGYGLPLAEALAAGVPVVASDISAHREIGDIHADYVAPHDQPGWKTAVLNRMGWDSDARRTMLARLQSYRPNTWPDHFRAVSDILSLYAKRPID